MIDDSTEEKIHLQPDRVTDFYMVLNDGWTLTINREGKVIEVTEERTTLWATTARH